MNLTSPVLTQHQFQVLKLIHIRNIKVIFIFILAEQMIPCSEGALASDRHFGYLRHGKKSNKFRSGKFDQSRRSGSRQVKSDKSKSYRRSSSSQRNSGMRQSSSSSSSSESNSNSSQDTGTNEPSNDPSNGQICGDILPEPIAIDTSSFTLTK